MKPKVKTAFLFTGTLLIGIVIGILLGGRIHRMLEENFWQQTPQQRISGILKKELHLDASQEAFADSIIQARYREFVPPPPVAPDPMLFMFSDLEEELVPVLKEHQKELLKQYIAAMSQNVVAMRVAIMKERLNLSGDQERKIQRLFMEMGTQVRHRFPHGPGAGPDRPPMAGEIADSFRVKLESVLTAEQLNLLHTRMPPEGRPRF